MKRDTIICILCAIAFVGLMALSSYMTATSLFRLQPDFSIFIWLGLALVFFAVASAGLGLIINSLNQKRRVEYRVPKLIGGVVMLLIAWVFVSFPTNTHTLFYKTEAKEVLASDLSRMSQELEKVTDRHFLYLKKKAEYDQFQENVNTALRNYIAEVMNPKNPTHGEKAEGLWNKIKLALGVTELHRTYPRSSRLKDLQDYCDQIEKQVEAELKIQSVSKGANYNAYKESIDDVKKLKVALDSVAKTLHSKKFIVKNGKKIRQKVDEPTQNTLLLLEEANQALKNYDNIVKTELIKEAEKKKKAFDKAEYEANTVKPKSVTNIQKLTSVVDTWKAYFNGEYDGRGFAYWIMLSLLIDVAGFFMGYFAFNSDEDEF